MDPLGVRQWDFAMVEQIYGAKKNPQKTKQNKNKKPTNQTNKQNTEWLVVSWAIFFHPEEVLEALRKYGLSI